MRVVFVALAAGLVAYVGSTPAATPAFTSASSGATPAPSPTLTIATPDGAGAGHVLVAAVAFRVDAALSAPGGWTEVVRTTCSNSTTRLTQVVLVKAASEAEPPSHSFSVAAATGAVGSIVAYSGVHLTQPVDASGGQTTRNSKWTSAPSITTSVPGTLLVAALTNSGRAAIPTPGGMAVRGDATTGSAAPSARMLAADQLFTPAGATGGRSSQTGGTNACAVGQLVALRPAPDPPASTSPPVVSGTAQEGHVLTVAAGSWSNAPTGYGHQWQRSSDGGQTWTDIAGATTASYSLTAAEVSFRIRAVVTASNAGGSGAAATEPTAAVLPAPPVSLSPPTISGTPRESETLTAGTGTWSGSPTAYAYAWERCSGATCTAVAGADAGTYVLAAADVGLAVRVVVRASNVGGSGSAASADTSSVQPAAPPSNVDPPTISGTAQEGETLAATAGTWSGSPTGYAYRWQRSGADGQSWDDIPAAVATAYALVSADVGSSVRVLVTAENGSGSTSTASAASAVVAGATPPQTVAPPEVSGIARVGEVLSATAGAWMGPPATFAFQWQSSSDGGQAWVGILGAVSSTYVPSPADLGLQLRVAVTATNAGGSATASSPATDAVLPAPPASTSAPLVSGAAVEGGNLIASTGDWLGDPSSYGFQWQRCDQSGANCATVWWAAAGDFPLRAEDVGLTLRVVVTATNEGGSTAARSEPTAVVLPLPPVNEERPTVSGVLAEGELLTAVPGSWHSSGPLSYAYRWQRSGDGGGTWADVSGAVGASHRLVSADVGSQLRVVVSASSAGGSAGAASDATAVVTGPGAPTSTELPALSGYTQVGRALSTTTGAWSGSPTSFTYRWQRSVDGGATWAELSGATGDRFVLTAAHLGSAIRAVVTAANGLGTGTASSHPVDVYAAGNLIAAVNQTWYCTTAVNLDLVKITITDRRNRDAIRFDNCTGRIARVEVDTNGTDGLKVRNNAPVAHDLVVEEGYVRCTDHPEGVHQDGIQAMGGFRITFRNLVIWCGDLAGDHGEGFVSSALLGLAGAGASIPTDIVIEHSVTGMGNANGVHVANSVRNGIRGSVACPDRTPGNGPVFLAPDAVEGIDVDNEKPSVDDPRCSSFDAAVAWAHQ